VLLRPAGVPPDLLGWLPLLAGVAVASAVADSASVEARLKWPNDVLAGGAKLAGILAEGTGDAIVVGVGINVSQRAGELPGPAATSLALAAAATSPAATPPAAAPAPGPGGAATSRPSGAGGEHLPAPVSGEHLLGAVLTRLARWYLAWRDQAAPGDADACGLRAEYVRLCATIGQDALVMLPNDRSLSGRAAGVDRGGALEVITPGGPVRVSAGDVVQVRPAAQVAP
jgi:BirA family biotin operon repressor/biotin-[acetyl-CoA-carboxylase] ligase